MNLSCAEIEGENRVHYYKVGFHAESQEKDWLFYIKSEKALTNDEIKEKFQNEFLGVHGLEQHHIDNIDMICEISAGAFMLGCFF